MTAHVSRAELFSRGAKGGAAADTYDDNDLSYLRLLIDAELLGGRPFPLSFPNALTVGEASDARDDYTA